MQKIKIKYDPYKMKTSMSVDGIDVCSDVEEYAQFKEFISTNTPLQTWIEPISYKSWDGIVNELKSDEEGFDTIELHFEGRRIDFEDLKRTCESENASRKTPLEITYYHDVVYSDEKLAENIDYVMMNLLSERFAGLVNAQGTESTVYKDYQKLEENYKRTKQKDFKIVFAGLYSSGKSTILNSIIRHNVLPTSDKTCTAKTCRIRHDGTLKNSITLECFDKAGNTVVPKETFKTDEECLERFWKITPLGSSVSVPKNVDVIELSMDLSHLYPSKEMEKAFNIVIVDTPGCNSRKKSSQVNGDNQDDNILDNTDKKLALDAITGEDREMVVVCADAQDYDDESIGDFLKAIHEASKDDVGDFNDRFLFVLNKCDALKFSRDEKIADSKSDFADYLMDTKRWGIKQTSLKFVPRVFMISAYNYFALNQGVADFSEEEISESEEKQNLSDAYDDFCKKVVRRKNNNYFLSQTCDIPSYRKKQYQEEFEAALEDDEDKALKIQTGICCIEGAIRDYIARYAYPLKVRDLMSTFDKLLDSVKEFSDAKTEIVKERICDMGKDISEKEEVERKKQAEEEKEKKLSDLRKRVQSQKNKINDINIDVGRLQQIREDMDVKMETNASVIRVRNSSEKEVLTDREIDKLTGDISSIFKDTLDETNKVFNKIKRDYKDKINSICDNLNKIAIELQGYNIYGYNFSSSLSFKKIQLKDVKNLESEIKNTKEIKSHEIIETQRNPIKDVEYKSWQIFKKINQWWASDTIEVRKTVNENQYSVESLKRYLTDKSGELKKLTSEMQENYLNELATMKKNAAKMADDVVNDISTVVEKISDYKNRIDALGDNIEKLQAVVDECNDTVEWLEQLVDHIHKGGIVND